MKLFLKIKTNASRPGIVKISDTNFKISVSESPEKGKANAAVTRVLAEYLKIAPSRIFIVAGTTSKNKIVEVI